MKSAKFREAERVTPEIGSMENYNEQEEESYSSLGFRDDVLIEGEEADFGFEHFWFVDNTPFVSNVYVPTLGVIGRI